MDNTPPTQTNITHREDYQAEIMVTIYDMLQIIKFNDQQAILGRTVRRITIVGDTENILLKSALQAAVCFIPAVNSSSESGHTAANTNVNRNLFLSANNARLPANIFTIYHGG